MAKTTKNQAAAGKPATKAAPNVQRVQKVAEPHPDTALLAEVETFLNERIADGGATTDHLKVMLNKIKPPASEQQNQHAAEAPPGTAPIT